MNCGAYVFVCVCSKTHLEGFKEDGVFSPRLRLSGSTYIRTMHCLQESLPGKCLICNRRIWLRLEVWFGFQRGGMCMQLGGVVGNLKSVLLTKLIYRDVRICQHMLHKRLPQSEPRFFPLAIACYKSLLKQRWNLSFNQFLFRSLTFNKCIQNFFYATLLITKNKKENYKYITGWKNFNFNSTTDLISVWWHHSKLFCIFLKKEVFVKEIYHGIYTILWSTEYTPWFSSV